MTTGSESATLAVLGGSGFVASAVCRYAENAGFAVRPLHAPRISVLWGTDPLVAARRWCTANHEAVGELLDALKGTSTLVNAAGLAVPADDKHGGTLWGANAVLPAVVALLAVEGGIQRFIHVSSAAVQGRRDPLDEQPHVAPVTPYAEAKAAGEDAARKASGAAINCVIYRPTSVQGPDRGMTRQIVSLCRSPIVPVPGEGGAPLPVTLVENVAAGIVHIAGVAVAPGIVLQPSEGLTARCLFQLLGAKRLVSVPRFVFGAGIWVLTFGSMRRPGLVALARRVELIAFGQRIQASALENLGYVAPVGHEGYRALRL